MAIKRNKPTIIDMQYLDVPVGEGYEYDVIQVPSRDALKPHSIDDISEATTKAPEYRLFKRVTFSDLSKHKHEFFVPEQFYMDFTEALAGIHDALIDSMREAIIEYHTMDIDIIVQLKKSNKRLQRLLYFFIGMSVALTYFLFTL